MARHSAPAPAAPAVAAARFPLKLPLGGRGPESSESPTALPVITPQQVSARAAAPVQHRLIGGACARGPTASPGGTRRITACISLGLSLISHWRLAPSLPARVPQMARRAKAGEALLSVDGAVYDVGQFSDDHPGGSGMVRASSMCGGPGSRATCCRTPTSHPAHCFYAHSIIWHRIYPFASF